MIVPPDDAWALRLALRHWLTDQGRRRALKEAALRARDAARTWSATTLTIAETLAEAAGGDTPGGDTAPAATAPAAGHPGVISEAAS